ncbi:juvenile hormone acid O-methyltransferase-like [Musca vetustissima]|uniref:juvenile hormone acid O-methyltransferase-like n=1 Tax=Musca vetustissima TaxID=27455 RepID=UPI002AB6B711|nr:juvenile hormone acid O-methyltransferase-like [Musca vetustissima]
MDNPQLYYDAHELQKKDAIAFYKQYASMIRWRNDGCDSVIDIGSGPGDVVSDCLYPRMPRKYQRLVFSDIKRSMMEYARKHYQHLPNTEFKVLNIESHEELAEDLRGQFDHITSNYCLQLVVDQRQAFTNIYNLLRPEGGDILINTAPYVSLFDGFTSLSHNEKWSPYMQDTQLFTSGLQHVENPKQYMLDLLEAIGFRDYYVEIKDRVYIYTLDAYKVNVKAISPYIPRIPIHMQDDFMEDFIDAIINLDWESPIYSREDNTIRMPYTQMIIYARKPNTLK